MAATIKLEANRLIISPEAMELLDLKAKNRVDVRYFTVNNELTFPVIGKIEVFGDADGKLVTASNSISYRGAQREVLAIYGEDFLVEPFKDGMYKLVSIN